MILTRRQKEILDYVADFLGRNGYAPSLEEIGHHFHLSSPATVHKHLKNLEKKGAIARDWNRSRSLRLVSPDTARARFVPLAGEVAAGEPIEVFEVQEKTPVPEEMVGRKSAYVLRVRGESMIGDHIRDGDCVIVEKRKTAENGETVIALIDGDQATLKKFYREKKGMIRLEPSNPGMAAILRREEDVQIQGVVIGLMRKY